MDNGGAINSFDATALKISSSNIKLFNSMGSGQNVCSGKTDASAAVFIRLNTQSAYLWSLASGSTGNICLLDTVSYPVVSTSSNVLNNVTIYVNDDVLAKSLKYNYRVGEPIGSDLTNGKKFTDTFFKTPTEAWQVAKTKQEIVYNISDDPEEIEYDPKTPTDSTRGIIYNKTNYTAYVQDYIGSDKNIGIALRYDGNMVDEIGAGAFRGMNIESITIPENIKKICGYAFAGCEQLKTVYLHEGLEVIEEGAFQGCSQLEIITIPTTIKEIGPRAFEGCSIHTLTTPIIGDGGDNKNIDYFFGGVIPASLDKIIISNGTEIPSDSFKNLNNITEITYLKDITKIGDRAFAHCSNLRMVNYNRSSPLQEIGEEAFIDCVCLTEVLIPNSTTKIKKRAFANCSSLTEINIPIGVQIIEDGILSGCSSLTNITVPFVNNVVSDSTTYTFGYIFGEIYYPGSSLTEQRCLINGNVTNKGFYLPDSLTEITVLGGDIQDYVFENCQFLQTFNLLNSPTIIGKYTFSGCDDIERIVLPDTVEQIGEYAFHECNVLAEVVLPKATKTIDKHAFDRCRSLVNISFAEDSELEHINEGAFMYCASLEELYLPTKVKSLGKSAFKECPQFKSIYIPVESELQSIGEQAFYNCNELSKIFIPRGVSAIGENAFWNCGGLQYIVVDHNNEYYLSSWNCLIERSSKTLLLGCNNSTISKDPNVLTKIAANAFLNRTNLQSVEIFDNIESIEQGAFRGCSGLRHIVLSFTGLSKTATGKDSLFGNLFGIYSFSGASRIKQYYGEGASDFEEFYIPNNIETIDIFSENISNYAFNNCTMIKKVSLFSGIKAIGDYAFAGCNLEEVFISKDLEQIGNYAFYECDELQHVYYYSSTEDWNKIIKGEGNECLSSAQIIYIVNKDMDFIGFTFNGLHSWYNLGVLRVTKGDRIVEMLAPQMKDVTAEATGNDGQFYFGTWHQTKTFQIDVAFDNLSEERFRKWKRFCNGKELGDLIFDEMPYKVYTAKITGTPQLDFLCFDEDGKRVYKGEGSIQFTCYWPYAHTPNHQTKISARDSDTDTPLQFCGPENTTAGKELQYYPEYYGNKDLWGPASGIPTGEDGNQFATGCNFGDMPAHFKLKYGGEYAANSVFTVGNNSITVETSGSDFVWDSRTGLITSNNIPISYSGDPVATIPVGENSGFEYGINDGGTSVLTTADVELIYDYWYY